MIRGVVASGKRRGGVPVQIILTSGNNWTVPADWNNANNKIECIGAGYYGGGAYARKNNVALTPGGNVTYRIGTPSTDPAVAKTNFVDSVTVEAAGSIGTTGGAAASCVGDVKYSGGTVSGGGARGGGGAAGPHGDGLPNSTSTGGAGDAGFGGAGGASGVAGQPGTEWGTAGSGGGGGYQANGGSYGAGGGAGAGAGAPGLIVITYTPA